MLLEEGGQVAGAKPVYASFTSQMLRLLVNYNSRWHNKWLFKISKFKCTDLVGSTDFSVWTRHFFWSIDWHWGQCNLLAFCIRWYLSSCIILLTGLPLVYQIRAWRPSTLLLHMWPHKYIRRVWKGTIMLILTRNVCLHLNTIWMYSYMALSDSRSADALVCCSSVESYAKLWCPYVTYW